MNVGLVLCFFKSYIYDVVHLMDKFNTAEIEQVSHVKEPTSTRSIKLSGYEIL